MTNLILYISKSLRDSIVSAKSNGHVVGLSYGDGEKYGLGFVRSVHSHLILPEGIDIVADVYFGENSTASNSIIVEKNSIDEITFSFNGGEIVESEDIAENLSSKFIFVSSMVSFDAVVVKHKILNKETLLGSLNLESLVGMDSSNGNIFTHETAEPIKVGGNKGKGSSSFHGCVRVNIDIVTRAYRGNDTTSPVVELETLQKSESVEISKLHLSACGFFPKNSACKSILLAIQKVLVEQLKMCSHAISKPNTCVSNAVFCLFVAPFPFQIFYPLKCKNLEDTDGLWNEQRDSELTQLRSEIHESLCVSKDFPSFLLGCALRCSGFSKKELSEFPLKNVHVGQWMRPHGVAGADVHLVKGDYEYYHYRMDGYDDKGWGCAYRSLQTITSWFRLNQYMKPVEPPTHREIQSVLVSIGDKPASFVGTKDWIGSQEVGYCLQEYTGNESRFIFCNKGSQIADKARELSRHFDEQGTPIMIGGGNLAFTLLGVAHNTATGEVKFLILDPHYIGPHNMQAIQSKVVMLEGYKAIPCTWRGLEAFTDKSFYCLCLPQKPKGMF